MVCCVPKMRIGNLVPKGPVGTIGVEALGGIKVRGGCLGTTPGLHH